MSKLTADGLSEGIQLLKFDKTRNKITKIKILQTKEGELLGLKFYDDETLIGCIRSDL